MKASSSLNWDEVCVICGWMEWDKPLKKSIFIPDVMFERAWEISPEYLRKRGITGVILDIDNTLALANHPSPYDGITEWLGSLVDDGMGVVMLSNNTRKRVLPFADKMGFMHISAALKPLKLNFRRAARKMGKPISEIAVVGDQIFTDVVGGNRAGMFTILVTPFEPKTEGGFFFRVKRRMEQKYIAMYKQQKNADG